MLKTTGEQLDILAPRNTSKAPPIKTQGIKTKVVPIGRSIEWSGGGRWIEPFLGSAVVALNIAPERALLADTNQHMITLYRGIQDGSINGNSIRHYLEHEGTILLDQGERHYYAVRERFNELADPFDFVFLSRFCFNGMMRFNRKGGYNVPFCRKPERFRPALITKIVNQVEWARAAMEGKEWEFVTQNWRTTVSSAQLGDLIYCDPPYVGRHTRITTMASTIRNLTILHKRYLIQKRPSPCRIGSKTNTAVTIMLTVGLQITRNAPCRISIMLARRKACTTK